MLYTLFLKTFHKKKSAKLRALRSKNVPTCQCALRAYVLCMLTCQYALRAYVFTCQRPLRAYMFMCQRASFDGTVFSFAAIVAEVVHIPGKVKNLITVFPQ